MMGHIEGSSADAESRTPGDDSTRSSANAASADDADVAQLPTSKEDAETKERLMPQPIPIICKSIEPDNTQNGSDNGSIDINSLDDILQRAASPAGSFNSDANLTPSVLVCSILCPLDELLRSNSLAGLPRLFSRKQRTTFSRITSLPQQSDSFVSTLRSTLPDTHIIIV